LNLKQYIPYYHILDELEIKDEIKLIKQTLKMEGASIKETLTAKYK